MIQRPSAFRTPLARLLAATLCSVFLALSISSAFHRGDHDDLGWLPERFHRHAFEWAAESAESPHSAVDHCLACHLARTLVRFTPTAPALPEGLDPLQGSEPSRIALVAHRATFPRTPRAPPAS